MIEPCEGCLRRVGRGRYQRDVLLGQALLSGADLKGRAREYSGRYKASRESVLARALEAGFEYRIEGGTARSGPMRIVWTSAPPCPCSDWWVDGDRLVRMVECDDKRAQANIVIVEDGAEVVFSCRRITAAEAADLVAVDKQTPRRLGEFKLCITGVFG